MKVGDKVRFLNDVGGGTICGFKDKNIVIVEDEDGFEIPVLAKECVVIEPSSQVQVRDSLKNFEPDLKNSTIESNNPIVETKEGETLTVAIAFLPIDIKELSTSNYESYLINDSNYFLMYNYMNRSSDGWISRAAGLIEPNTKVFLEEFEKVDLNDLEHVCLQFIAYKEDKAFSLKNAYSVSMHIDTVKFYKVHSFRENDYFEDNALLYPFVKKDLPEKELIISADEIATALLEKKKNDRRETSIVHKKERNAVVEVDLHIDELLDNTQGLSAKDMLDYQLSKFREIMDENKTNKGQKIVFIHGKGNGVLKKAIQDELKLKYKSVYSQDASFREYGFGATMITIR